MKLILSIKEDAVNNIYVRSRFQRAIENILILIPDLFTHECTGENEYTFNVGDEGFLAQSIGELFELNPDFQYEIKD